MIYRDAKNPDIKQGQFLRRNKHRKNFKKHDERIFDSKKKF